jgi:signal transduction histidine kinase
MTPLPKDSPPETRSRSDPRSRLHRGLSLGSSSLRGRFLVVLFLGSVVPLGLVGWWLTTSTRRSGEELLQVRLEATLSGVVHTIGFNWVDLRSDLLALTEIDELRAALGTGRDVFPAGDTGGLQKFEAAWTRVEEAVDAVVFYDLAGDFRGRYPSEDASSASRRGLSSGSVFPRRMDVYGRGSEGRVGTMEVRLRTASLLPSDLVLPGLAGSVLALFDASGTFPLLPLSIDPDLFAQDRFTWAEETWLTVRDTLYEPPLQVVLAAPLGALGQPFETAAQRGLMALLVVLAGAVLLVTLATRRITRPLGELADGADTVARGNLDVMVAEQGPDEVRRVAGAFNTMTENLRRTLQELSQRESLAAVGEFAASLAHEVRNPLTAISLDLKRAQKHVDGGIAKELLDEALREVKRLDASVTDALRLARSGLLSPVRLDLRQPLQAALRAAEPAFQEGGGALQPLALPEEPVWVKGEPGALEQLFLNLLLNSAQALGPGGQAGIDIAQDARFVRISIWDTGKGIPAEEMDRIFEPFFSTSSEGTGLGLPIAQRIARAHGGELRLESTPGRGTTARVTLPAADPAVEGVGPQATP